ncbi:MAG: DUF3783 domain-containing protein [Lachnospiraceae bacterium]|nr:DUF3783 domain-containing protein [Lachnospiraceae bacterium]
MRVFVYELKFDQMSAVSKAAKAVGAEIVNIKDEDIHASIGSLVDEKNDRKAGMDVDKQAGELMIFEGFSGNDLDEFLSVYNSTGFTRVKCKAMITVFNLLWSPAYLYEHLLEEAENFRKK